MKQQTMTGVLCAGLFTLGISAANAALLSGQGTWETTLQGRDLDGNAATFEAYYDTTLDITWLADANAAGTMTWADANAWVAGLTLGGFNDWRLPKMVDTGEPGCNFANHDTDCGYNVQTGSASTTVYSEMASLWYDTLGNISFKDTAGVSSQPGWGLTNTGPFSNLQPVFYWSVEENDPNTAWNFSTNTGGQNINNYASLYAWAVRSGDVRVNTVPEPAAAWLFGTGLIGLLGVAIRKRSHEGAAI